MTTHAEQLDYWKDYHRKRRSNPEEREKDNEYQRQYRKLNPEKVREQTRRSEQRRRWKKYGVTQELWDETFNSQGSACAICKSTDHRGRGWHTDHCHTTNTFRGILCSQCNLLLGNALDNEEILSSAIQYLRRTQCQSMQ